MSGPRPLADCIAEVAAHLEQLRANDYPAGAPADQTPEGATA